MKEKKEEKNSIIVFYVLSLLFNLRFSCRVAAVEFNGTRNHGSIFPLDPHQRSIRSHLSAIHLDNNVISTRHIHRYGVSLLFSFLSSNSAIRQFCLFNGALLFRIIRPTESWILKPTKNGKPFSFSLLEACKWLTVGYATATTQFLFESELMTLKCGKGMERPKVPLGTIDHFRNNDKMRDKGKFDFFFGFHFRLLCFVLVHERGKRKAANAHE